MESERIRRLTVVCGSSPAVDGDLYDFDGPAIRCWRRDGHRCTSWCAAFRVLEVAAFARVLLACAALPADARVLGYVTDAGDPHVEGIKEEA